VARTVAVGDAPLTVVATPDDVIAVIYSGGDNQGIRKVELEYEGWRQVGCCSTQQTLVVAKFKESSCPRESLLGSENFDPAGGWNFRFTTRSDNWLGTSARSATVTVRTQ
jgi:hypothetical protein